jgi:hypothetical protein
MLLQRPTVIVVMAVLVLGLWLGHTPAHAVEVSFLNITGGSVSLQLDSLPAISGSYTNSFTLLMGEYQAPALLPAVTVAGHTFSLFTNSGPGPTPIPAPTAMITGTTISVNLSSLFAGISGPILNGMLGIGGPASGTFNPETGAFHISWIRLYNPGPLPFLSQADFSLDGLVPPAAVPIPGAVFLMATGLAGFVALARRRPIESI